MRPETPGLRGFQGPQTRFSSWVSTTVTGASKLSRTDPPHGIRVAAEWKGSARGRPEREPQHNSRQPATLSQLHSASPRLGATPHTPRGPLGLVVRAPCRGDSRDS